MTSGSVLKNFWPILKFLKLIGCCPIKKNEDRPCGFEAISSGPYLAILLLNQIVLFSLMIGSGAFLAAMNNLPLEEMPKIVFSITGAPGGSEGSSMDTICIFGMMMLMMFVNYAILIGKL